MRAQRVERGVRRLLRRRFDLVVPEDPALVSSPRRTVLSAHDRSGGWVIAKGSYGGRLDREVAVHRWLTSAGMPVPEIVGVTGGSPQVLVTERLPGPALADRADPEAWRDAGRLLRRLHDLGVPTTPALPHGPIGTWLPSLRREVEVAVGAGRLDDAAAETLVRFLARAAPAVEADGPRGVCHGDAVPGHFLFDRRGKLHVIDVEWVRIDDPAWDLAVLTTFAPDRLDAVLDGYGADREEERRLREVIAIRQVERLLYATNWLPANGHPVDRCAAALAERMAEMEPGGTLSR